MSIFPWDKKTYYQAFIALLSAVTRRDVYDLMKAFGRRKGAKQTNE